jgi:hypothetical protein
MYKQTLSKNPFRHLKSLMVSGISLTAFLGLSLSAAAGPNIPCPDGTELIAKFEWNNGGYQFEKPAGNANVVTINGDATNGHWNSQQPISDVILKGATGTYTYDYSAANTSGNFSKFTLPKNNGGQYPAISNIQFCASLDPNAPVSATEENSSFYATAAGRYQNGCQVDGKTLPVVGWILKDEGYKVGKVTNSGNQPYQVTLVAYEEFYSHSNFKHVYEDDQMVKLGQRVFDYVTMEVGPGQTINLDVELPGCPTQIDLVCGQVIEYLGDGLYGNRKLAWQHLHQKVDGDDVWCDDGLFEPIASCPYSMASLTGISDGATVSGAFSIQAIVEGGTPKKVVFLLTGPDGSVVKTHTENKAPYYFLGDNNQWDTTQYPNGQYTMTVKVYNNAGVVCNTETITFTVNNEVASCPVNMDEIIGVTDGQLVTQGTILNIGATTTGDKPKKVRFELTGPAGGKTHDEGNAPYYYLGDQGGQPNGWDTTGLPLGQYTMQVSVYDNDGWNANPKDACGTQTVAFTLESACVPEFYAVHDDKLNDTQFLIVTGELEPIGGVHKDRDIEALALHPTTGVLYAASGDDTDKPGYLYTVNKTNGDITEIGSTGFNEVDGLAFDSNGVLWGWAQDEGIITIDTNTGVGTLVKEYLGEVEDLTWNVAGTTLYGVGNVNGNDPKEGAGDKTAKLLAYDGTNVTTVCEFDSKFEIEALETLPDDSLMVGFHGKKQVIVGVVDKNDCTITTIKEITTIFNDVEGISGRVCK